MNLVRGYPTSEGSESDTEKSVRCPLFMNRVTFAAVWKMSELQTRPGGATTGIPVKDPVEDITRI